MTNFERSNISPLIIKFIKLNKGKAVTSFQIIDHIASENGMWVSDPSLRKMIKEIQAEGKVRFIVSDHFGFRYTRSKKAVVAQILNWESRIAGIKRQIQAVKSQL